MRQETLSYLRQIVDTPSPSGYEADVQQQFIRQVEAQSLPYECDRMNNVIVNIASEGKPKLLISAHIDEIGFAVKHIDDKGRIYIVPVGGVDKMLLPSSRLIISHKGNRYLGVCGRKPIHLLSEQERNRFDWDDIWLDCGFSSRKHALQHVNIGDPVVFNSDFTELSDSLIVTRSADNKVGNCILVELIYRLMEHKDALKYDVYLASTVQEEIGLRGAMVAAFNAKPDICIVIDAAHATDYPSCNDRQHGEIKLGSGPVIAFSPDSSPTIVNELTEVAESNMLRYQRDVYPNAAGTETKAIQIQCGGILTATISYPVRYMHSPSEIFDLNDVSTITDILEHFVSI